jgi:hypothetical protein
MRGLNKVTLIGNLGKMPDVQILEGGIKVAKLSLATTEIYKDKNGQNHSETDRSAEAMAYRCAMAKFGRIGPKLPPKRQYGLCRR